MRRVTLPARLLALLRLSDSGLPYHGLGLALPGASGNRAPFSGRTVCAHTGTDENLLSESEWNECGALNRI
jgi:hypothetical protein